MATDVPALRIISIRDNGPAWGSVLGNLRPPLDRSMVARQKTIWLRAFLRQPSETMRFVADNPHWQERRDLNPHLRLWRPPLSQLSYSPLKTDRRRGFAPRRMAFRITRPAPHIVGCGMNHRAYQPLHWVTQGRHLTRSVYLFRHRNLF